MVIFRLSVTTRVATTTFVYLHLVEPFLGFHGKVVISLIIPSPSDGRQVPTFITPLVCSRLVILELWACPARNTSTIAMQASLWCAGNQHVQFGLILNWPRPLLLFSFQFYFTGLHARVVKSVSCPIPAHPFLGLLSDSVIMAFLLPEDKKLKFKRIHFISGICRPKTLQRFAGKTTSFSIAVPAARLYTRAPFLAISS